MIELPELLLPDASPWRAWLAQHHASSPGVRLVLGKKGGSVTALDYAGSLDEALCFGWIDGVVGRRDAGSYFIRYTPRTRTSQWSMNNVDRIGRLAAAGLLDTAGQAAVDAAKADGRWEAAHAARAAADMPAELSAAIEANPAAQAMFGVLTALNHQVLVYRAATALAATDTEAGAVAVAGLVDMLAAGEAPYPQKRRPQ